MNPIERIQRHVAFSFRIGFIDMTSQRRSRQVARPRQVAMYLARQLTIYSLPQIGWQFGGRDHTTVMHAITRIGELMVDPEFADHVALVRAELEMEIEHV